MASGLLREAVVLLFFFLLIAQGDSTLDITLGFAETLPGRVIAQRNKPLLINCSGVTAPKYQPINVSWFYEGQMIENDGHYEVLTNGSLFIERVQSQRKKRRDEGNYTCALQNEVGVLLSTPIEVIVATLGKGFSILPESTRTILGGVARFQCQIDALPSARYSWFQDDKILPHDDERYTILSSGVLQIVNVTHSDAGSYHCVAGSASRKRESPKAILTVEASANQNFEPPQFLSTSLQLVVVENSIAILECFVKNSAKITWHMKDGNFAKERAVILGQGNLFFAKVNASDAGSYICRASNTDPSTGETHEATQISTLVVQVPPIFVKKPESQTNPLAQTTRFECSSIGIPAPSLHWYKNGKPLYINGRIKQLSGNVLLISQTILSDSGIYQCMASNAAGSITTSARLLVNSSSSQPNAPFGLVAKTVSGSAILLSWKPSRSPVNLSIQAYTVHYVPTNGGLEKQVVAVNTSQIIDKLLPFTNYTFYVRAYNHISASEQSETIVHCTGEDIPLKAPEVSLSALSPTSIRVSWTTLPLHVTQGMVVGYRIHYRKHMQASHVVIETAGTVKEYTITGLIPKKKYDVRVMGGTKAGFPLFSDNAWPWVTFETLDSGTAKVPNSPVLHLTVVNSTTLEVKWGMEAITNDEHAADVKGFKLTYRQKGYALQPAYTLLANVSSFLLTDLAPQTWYEVHVVALNEEGEGKESVRMIMTFPENHSDSGSIEVLEPPTQLEAEPLTPSLVRLEWKIPSSNINITYFTVRYHPIHSHANLNDSSVHYIRSTNSEVNITDLKPATLYEFSVRSHDVNNQQGPFGVKVECKTLESVPSMPLDLRWAPLNISAIRLSWLPPERQNGNLLGYRVLYSNHISDMTLTENWLGQRHPPNITSAVLGGLQPNTLYYICMKAETNAGLGLPTPLITVHIPVRQNYTNKQPIPGEGEIPLNAVNTEKKDPLLGIILGITIGLVCIIICIIIILCRNRCCPINQPGGNYIDCCGEAPRLNGHPGHLVPKRIDGQEMDAIAPMLAETHLNTHIDTKGGYPIVNGHGAIQHMGSNHRPYANGIEKQRGTMHEQPHNVPKPTSYYGVQSNGFKTGSNGTILFTNEPHTLSSTSKQPNREDSCPIPPLVPPHRNLTPRARTVIESSDSTPNLVQHNSASKKGAKRASLEVKSLSNNLADLNGLEEKVGESESSKPINQINKVSGDSRQRDIKPELLIGATCRPEDIAVPDLVLNSRCDVNLSSPCLREDTATLTEQPSLGTRFVFHRKQPPYSSLNEQKAVENGSQHSKLSLHSDSESDEEANASVVLLLPPSHSTAAVTS